MLNDSQRDGDQRSMSPSIGNPSKAAELAISKVPRLPGDFKALIFDLDDTLVDTYGQLIVPLEELAAKRMLEAQPNLGGARAVGEEDLATCLLRLRRSAPHDLEKRLRQEYLAVSSAALKVRMDVELGVSLDALALDQSRFNLLERSGEKYLLLLVTQGEDAFQNQKIERLGIGECFAEIVIVPPGRDSKKQSMGALLRHHDLAPRHAVVIGNRIDNEIAAGNELGCATVWVKTGEGSEMQPQGKWEQPDCTVERLEDLEQVLGKGC